MVILGFEWRVRDNTFKQQQNDELFANVIKALQVYKVEISEDFEIPIDFEVPPESPWPEETWNLKLGAQVQNIRDKGSIIVNRDDREKALAEIGKPVV